MSQAATAASMREKAGAVLLIELFTKVCDAEIRVEEVVVIPSKTGTKRERNPNLSSPKS